MDFDTSLHQPLPQEVIYKILHNGFINPRSSGVSIYAGRGGSIQLAKLVPKEDMKKMIDGKSGSGLADHLKSSDAISDLVKKSKELSGKGVFDNGVAQMLKPFEGASIKGGSIKKSRAKGSKKGGNLLDTITFGIL